MKKYQKQLDEYYGTTVTRTNLDIWSHTFHMSVLLVENETRKEMNLLFRGVSNMWLEHELDRIPEKWDVLLVSEVFHIPERDILNISDFARSKFNFLIEGEGKSSLKRQS